MLEKEQSVADIAANLSEAQKRAVLETAPEEPRRYGEVTGHVRCALFNKHLLQFVERKPYDGRGYLFGLTLLGLAVREHLQSPKGSEA